MSSPAPAFHLSPSRPSVLGATLAGLAAGLLAVAGPARPAAAAEGYLRTPDLHGERVVFAAEGDLWTAPVGGGAALRLTTGVGTELFPKFSPDGESIAFTGDYDGNRDVFVIPVGGGEPRRLTWHPSADTVVNWSPDGREVLFRSRREHPHGSHELFAVPVTGGDARKLPLGWASRISIEPSTGRWAFNRRTREHRTWKRYRGGTATDIWVGHPDRMDYRPVTRFDGMDAFPSWHGGRIYFLSDQGGTANLWSIRPDGTDRRRHTRHDEWDARHPSMGPDGRLVYMSAGGLRVFDPGTGQDREIAIALPSDRTLTRNRYPDAGRHVSFVDLSPDGTRLALTARGEVFSVPAEDGVTLPVSRGSGERESWATFGPDGEKLYFVSDAAGEEAIHVVDAWGREEAEVVVAPGTSRWHLPPVPSPDGKWIAWSDQEQVLWIAPARGGTPIRVDQSPQWEIRHHAWSPDGRWLAYSWTLPTNFSSIRVFDTREREVHDVTGPTTDDTFPAWDPKGRYLYFLSSRTMDPVIGWRDFETLELENTKPHLVLLREDVENPFANRAGLPGGEREKQPGRRDRERDEDDEEVAPVEIDWEGISRRVVALPVEPGILSELGATASRVLWLTEPVRGLSDWNDDEGPVASLVSFDLEEEETTTIAEGVAGYELASGSDAVALVKEPGEIFVFDLGERPPEDLSKHRVSLDDVVIELDPRDEWAQIFQEGWRHMRDFHWDESMAGVDWNAVREKYAALLPRVATRDDLRDLMGEAIGELATSHTYAWGGDHGPVEAQRVATGLLGADLAREGDAYRIVRVYHGDPADEEPSPLREPGVGLSEGDLILAVNHRPPRSDRPFLASLQGLAGREVVLTVADGGTSPAGRRGGSGPRNVRDVVVTTLTSETPLRYADWVRRNREHVAERTGGRIGYLHVPDMGRSGLVEFDTWFYPQLDKEGMVVDVRWNGGGFVSQLLLERFRRKVISFSRARGGGVRTYPYRVLNGPFVVLTNQFAGSDGDIFPRAVQLEGLAPVIGKRSWGGVVGIRADKRLVDGGMLTQPEFAWWDPVDGWGLENRGVEPDIVIENLPQELARGVDAQLEQGIVEVERLHRTRPPLEPDFGPAPRKDREWYQRELEPSSPVGG